MTNNNINLKTMLLAIKIISNNKNSKETNNFQIKFIANYPKTNFKHKEINNL